MFLAIRVSRRRNALKDFKIKKIKTLNHEEAIAVIIIFTGFILIL